MAICTWWVHTKSNDGTMRSAPTTIIFYILLINELAYNPWAGMVSIYCFNEDLRPPKTLTINMISYSTWKPVYIFLSSDKRFKYLFLFSFILILSWKWKLYVEHVFGFEIKKSYALLIGWEESAGRKAVIPIYTAYGIFHHYFCVIKDVRYDRCCVNTVGMSDNNRRREAELWRKILLDSSNERHERQWKA